MSMRAGRKTRTRLPHGAAARYGNAAGPPGAVPGARKRAAGPVLPGVSARPWPVRRQGAKKRPVCAAKRLFSVFLACNSRKFINYVLTCRRDSNLITSNILTIKTISAYRAAATGDGLSHRRAGGRPLLCENLVFKCIPPHTHQAAAGVSCRRAAFSHR